jgi:hypothetical protein
MFPSDMGEPEPTETEWSTPEMEWPLSISLIWDEGKEEWDLSTNCDEETLAAGLAWWLYKMASGDQLFDVEPGG